MYYEDLKYDEIKYLIRYPDGYKDGNTYPVILFLHGAGSRGTEMQTLKENDFFSAISEQKEFPYIVVAPLCSKDTWFDIFQTLEKFTKYIFESSLNHFQKIFLFGTSMGAYTAWQLAMSLPEYFAALVPVCGGGMYWNAGRLKDIPVWAFHGEKDTTVLVEESKKMVNAVNASGGCAKLTIYENVHHDSWVKAYRTKELWAWLSKQSTPEWYRRNPIYQINLRTFSEEGTIQSVIPEIPFLNELGFKTLYLCPVVKADNTMDGWSPRQRASQTNNPNNPYRLSDQFEIDEEYGTLEDLRQFVSAAHSLGMKVLLDLVYMHMAPSAKILQDHPEFAQTDENGQMKTNDYGFALLNFDCDGLREYLWANMVYFICEADVDGYRCDVGDAVPDDFWLEGRRRIRNIKPDAILLDEGFEMKRLATSFDICYGVDWEHGLYRVFEGKKTLEEFRAEYDAVKQTVPVGGGVVMRAFETHDTVTDWERGEVLAGHDGMEMVQVMNYVADGVPMVYCGNELADDTKINMFANRFHKGNFGVTNRKKRETVEGLRRQEIYKKLYQLHQLQTIQDGTFVWLETSSSDKILSFTREYKDDKILFAGNFSSEDVLCQLAVELKKENILMEHNVEVTENGLQMKSHGYIVIKI